jgi:hypothetical protein
MEVVLATSNDANVVAAGFDVLRDHWASVARRGAHMAGHRAMRLPKTGGRAGVRIRARVGQNGSRRAVLANGTLDNGTPHQAFTSW